MDGLWFIWKNLARFIPYLEFHCLRFRLANNVRAWVVITPHRTKSPQPIFFPGENRIGAYTAEITGRGASLVKCKAPVWLISRHQTGAFWPDFLFWPGPHPYRTGDANLSWHRTGNQYRCGRHRGRFFLCMMTDIVQDGFMISTIRHLQVVCCLSIVLIVWSVAQHFLEL